MTTDLLKLRAVDGEDVQVMSAVLQDAIAPVCDMKYQDKDGVFVVVVQRLRRERAGSVSERICCALTVAGVSAVQTQGIDWRDPERILDLLALMLNTAEASIDLVFAGGARIRLALGQWTAQVEDFGEPWPALTTPCHESSVPA